MENNVVKFGIIHQLRQNTKLIDIRYQEYIMWEGWYVVIFYGVLALLSVMFYEEAHQHLLAETMMNVICHYCLLLHKIAIH